MTAEVEAQCSATVVLLIAGDIFSTVSNAADGHVHNRFGGWFLTLCTYAFKLMGHLNMRTLFSWAVYSWPLELI